MVRNVRLLAVAALTVACGRSKGVSDDQLGALVLEPKPPAKIDVATAVNDVAELSRALASHHATVLAGLGAHSVSIDTKTVVTEGGQAVQELTDHTLLEIGDREGFKALYTNSADYGREAIYVPSETPPASKSKVSGKLYLRPRYQRWHARAPETPDEPAQIRDSFFSPVAATWDLVAPGAELTDRGAVTFAGRAARKIDVHASPSPRANPPETLTQRMWRVSRSISDVTGEIVLDAESGMPLAVKLAGTVAFSREGRRFTMKVDLDAKVTTTTAVAVSAPTDTEIIATPERRREVDERDFLLNGIAPPVRKNADGTAVAPVVTPVPAGSAAPSSPKDDKKPVKKGDKP